MELTRPPGGAHKTIAYIAGGVALLLAAALVWMYVGVVLPLQASQLPAAQFGDYDDCAQHGGLRLETVNGNFSACLGGKLASTLDNQVFLQYSAQNLPRLNERKTTNKTNVVEGVEGHSADLVAFLQHDYTGCDTGDTGNGYYKITKEVTGRFALLNYGCTQYPNSASGAYPMVAIKLADGWATISPTDHMQAGVPSCLMVDMFKISKELVTQCYENTGFNNGDKKDVTYK